MRSNFLSILISAFLLICCSGCSIKQGEVPIDMNLETYPINFVTTEGKVFQVDVPSSEKLLYSDNSSYYEFSSGTKFMATNTQIHGTEKLDKKTGVYYTKTGASVDVGNCCITVKCSKDMLTVYRNCLSAVRQLPVSLQLPEDKQSLSLPEKYINKSSVMELTSNGNYMPMESLKNVSGHYTADLITYDDKWCKCWVQDGVLSDIQDLALAYLTCASDTTAIDYWYISPKKDLLYSVNENAIFAAKALHYNAWEVYYTSPNFEDYVRTAVTIVHAK